MGDLRERQVRAEQREQPELGGGQGRRPRPDDLGDALGLIHRNAYVGGICYSMPPFCQRLSLIFSIEAS